MIDTIGDRERIKDIADGAFVPVTARYLRRALDEIETLRADNQQLAEDLKLLTTGFALREPQAKVR